MSNKPVPGRRFKRIHPNTFYCLTDENDINNGEPLQTGYNNRTVKWNEFDECIIGGIRLIDSTWLFKMKNFGFTIIRKAEVADDAEVYFDGLRYVTDKVILGERCHFDPHATEYDFPREITPTATMILNKP